MFVVYSEYVTKNRLFFFHCSLKWFVTVNFVNDMVAWNKTFLVPCIWCIKGYLQQIFWLLLELCTSSKSALVGSAEFNPKIMVHDYVILFW